MNFARPLNNNDLAFNFLTKVLDIREEEADEAAPHVMKAERLLESMELKSTLDSKENRRPLYKDDEKRVNLRRKIFDELIELHRIEDDELISLGNGGAKPNSPVQSKREAFLVTGPPASGKSFLANKIAEMYGAYIIDSDFAKRKIPEFGHEFGASIVHEESALITFGSVDAKYENEFNLYEFCIAKGHNMVIPKIGSNCESVREIRDALIEKGYKVHLLLVCLDRQETSRRALSRYLDTKRYVPLGLVFDVYGNEPTLTYYRIKEDEAWESVGKVSTLNLRDKGPEIVYSSRTSPLNLLLNSGGQQ
ncbi:zeta toxin family protein [Sessilibacter sp. MAH4]